MTSEKKKRKGEQDPQTFEVMLPKPQRRKKSRGPSFPQQLFVDWFGQFAEVHGKCGESPPQFFYTLRDKF